MLKLLNLEGKIREEISTILTCVPIVAPVYED